MQEPDQHQNGQEENQQNGDQTEIRPVIQDEEPQVLQDNQESVQNGNGHVEPDEEPQKIPEPQKGPEPPVVTDSSAKKVLKSTGLDMDAIKTAYEDVRADHSETQWAVFKFEGSKIVCSAKGTNFDMFKEQFSENERAFGYIRIQTGDEMSKRQKFLFVTWIGPGVSVIQRAKMSTDKAVIKNIISNFAVELQLENDSEIDLKHFVGELNRAGGANYGTGIRDV